jgi:hypothetical protein
MNELELQFPQWQAPFHELIVEFTLQGLPEALQKAEARGQLSTRVGCPLRPLLCCFRVS